MDIKTVVDAEMEKLKNKDQASKDIITPFFSALISNDTYKNALCNMIADATQKFGGVMMSCGGNQDDAKELIGTVTVARPMLEMAFIGFLVGKAYGSAEYLEKMFSSETSEAK